MVILMVLGALVVIYAVWVFNRLVALRTRANNAWSDIDVQLKRRWDLVPKLVETVRGYAKHETTTLQQTVEARGRAQNANTTADRSRAETDLGQQAIRLIALAESYPDLKADTLFDSLHHNLVEIEDALQSARRYYNAVVRDMNIAIQQFPALIVARLLQFKLYDFFQLEHEAEAAAPAVSMKDR
ncbi:MAG: LemA family protein [Planctomycetota bacterium]|jgi:LemA protein